jgi:hypothetical protein
MSTAAISRVEIHDPAVLDNARELIESLDPAGMQQAVVDAVDGHDGAAPVHNLRPRPS